MSTPRRHHLVPQFLLRRFAKHDRIGMIRRDGQQKQDIITTVKNAAVQTDFYTLDQADGTRTTEVESHLSTIEADAASVIKQFDTVGGFPPVEEQKYALARFLVYQLMRGSDKRDAIQQMHEVAAKIIADGPPREQVRDFLTTQLGRVPTEAEIDQEIRKVEVPPLPSANVIKTIHMSHMLEIAETRAEDLLSRSWQLYKFPAPILLTGDAPVVPSSPFGGPVGIINATEILFPIDPQHALVMWLDECEEGTVLAGSPESDYINFTIAVHCYKWIYYRPPRNPLAGVALPARGPMVQRMKAMPIS